MLKDKRIAITGSGISVLTRAIQIAAIGAGELGT